MNLVNYGIESINGGGRPDIHWDNPIWQKAESLELANFRPEGSSHRPRTRARLLHGNSGIHGIFRVEDQYVRSSRTEYMEPVYRDSCVEFFVQPKPDQGYFNFEFNCGGAMLATQVLDPERTQDGIRKKRVFPEGIRSLIEVQSSMPKTVLPEITEPVTWSLRFFIPFSVFEFFVGPLGPVPGQEWRANFYKCAEESSHPHWASWSPVDELNFHRPQCFGNIRFK
jgi:hypothetical protein